MTSPGPTGSPGLFTSLPVGTKAQVGRGITETSATWEAISAPTSDGVSRRPPVTMSSVATMSSPRRRTCCHGEAAAMISMTSSVGWWTSSIMMTASYPSGMRSPVLMGPAPSGMGIVTGLPSLAANVSSAFTAKPSIAAAQ